jgi:ELWxxDGT repeat protein
MDYFTARTARFIVFNGKVLFEGDDAVGKLGLWVTDGTVSGTYELNGIIGAYYQGLLSSPNFTIFNGEVFFASADASGSANLWVTDGTAAGTHELTGTGVQYRNRLFSSLLGMRRSCLS